MKCRTNMATLQFQKKDFDGQCAGQKNQMLLICIYMYCIYQFINFGVKQLSGINNAETCKKV